VRAPALLATAELCGFDPLEHWTCTGRSFLSLQRI
jgi:hypothetical protein